MSLHVPRTPEEMLAREGLNISGYAGKWEQACLMASVECKFEDERHLLPYWERVRLFFLELGGQFLDKHKV